MHHKRTISIVVPTLNEAPEIGLLLEKLRQRAPDAEIIIVDGGSSDSTAAMATGRCNQLLRTGRGRAVQMNSGAAVAGGEILWFLHADCEVPPNCTDAIRVALNDPRVIGGFFRIRIPRKQLVYRLTDSLGHYLGLALGMRFGDHGFFCRRTVFEEIGGYPDVELMEDGEFFRQLRKHGRIRVISSPIVVSARRFEAMGPIRLTLAYGLIAALYAVRAPLPVLARMYRRMCCPLENPD